MNKKKIVITGMGAVTPIGIGVDAYWENLIAGKSGIGLIELIDTTDIPVKVAGEIKGWNAKDYMPRKLASEMDRFMQFAFVAANEAIEDSGLNIDPYRTGITVGTALDGFGTITSTQSSYDASKNKRVGPRFLAKALGNICAAHISIEHDIKGPSMTVNTACASGGDAISIAAMMIETGQADAMVVVGGEAGVNTVLIQSLAAAQALTTNPDPATACRPFDKARDGFVIGEGAGTLILETEESAVARGAHIYAYLSGWGNTTDAYHTVTPRPDGEGEMRCIRAALEWAELEPEKIGYINTHGTSTVKGDIAETHSVNVIFGPDVPVSSTKGATGHMMGAGGITEVITCVKAVTTGIIPPTLNLVDQDEEIEVNNCVPLKAIERNVDYAMSNAFGFGGQNSSIIVGKYEK